MSQPFVGQTLRRKVADRAQRRCEYCQSAEFLTVGSFHVDHILPAAKGGATRLSNLAYSCPGCNGAKWSKVRGKDPETNRFAKLFNPRRQRWSEHFYWSNDAKQLRGRTACGRATIAALEINRDHLVQLRKLWKKWGYHPPKEFG